MEVAYRLVAKQNGFIFTVVGEVWHGGVMVMVSDSLCSLFTHTFVYVTKQYSLVLAKRQ